MKALRKRKEISPFSWVEKTPKKIRDAGCASCICAGRPSGNGPCRFYGYDRKYASEKLWKGCIPDYRYAYPEENGREGRKRAGGSYLSLNTPWYPVFSGGNANSVLVGQEIAEAPTVLMTAYAVRGLDINTSYTIYNLLNEEKKEGVAVVYVGDLDLMCRLTSCDRYSAYFMAVKGMENPDARTTTKRRSWSDDKSSEGGKINE